MAFDYDKPTPLCRIEPVDLKDPDCSLFVVIYPEGESSSPLPLKEATRRAEQINILIRAGNDLVAKSAEKQELQRSLTTALMLLDSLVTACDLSLPVELPQDVEEALEKAKVFVIANKLKSVDKGKTRVKITANGA